MEKNDIIAVVRRLEKYKELVFFNPIMSVFTLCSTRTWNVSVVVTVVGALNCPSGR